MKAGQFVEAQSYFSQVRELDPYAYDRSTIPAWQGIMAFYEGQYETATKHLQQYLDSNKKLKGKCSLYGNALYFQGYSWFKLKNPSQAVASFDEYTKEYVDLPMKRHQSFDRTVGEDALVRLGDCHFLMNEHRVSGKLYRKAFDLKGFQGDYALYQLALIADLKSEPYDQIYLLAFGL